jgi:hypothetical protein
MSIVTQNDQSCEGRAPSGVSPDVTCDASQDRAQDIPEIATLHVVCNKCQQPFTIGVVTLAYRLREYGVRGGWCRSCFAQSQQSGELTDGMPEYWREAPEKAVPELPGLVPIAGKDPADWAHDIMLETAWLPAQIQAAAAQLSTVTRRYNRLVRMYAGGADDADRIRTWREFILSAEYWQEYRERATGEKASGHESDLEFRTALVDTTVRTEALCALAGRATGQIDLEPDMKRFAGAAAKLLKEFHRIEWTVAQQTTDTTNDDDECGVCGCKCGSVRFSTKFYLLDDCWPICPFCALLWPEMAPQQPLPTFADDFEFLGAWNDFAGALGDYQCHIDQDYKFAGYNLKRVLPEALKQWAKGSLWDDDVQAQAIRQLWQYHAYGRLLEIVHLADVWNGMFFYSQDVEAIKREIETPELAPVWASWVIANAAWGQSPSDEGHFYHQPGATIWQARGYEHLKDCRPLHDDQADQ